MRTSPWRWFVRIALAAGILAVIGFAVAASGLIPIEASRGHWAITRWFLEFAKSRSIATHTLLGPAPELDAPWLVLKGAGHYENGCSPCHGSPARAVPPIAAAMLPRPPLLADRVEAWDADELVHIVQHGLKFTGMPAWPALGREDEVRAVVAFLQVLPGLDAAGYRQLVQGDAPEGPADVPLRELAEPEPHAAIAACVRCHGADGLGRGNAAFPKLAGQSLAYLDLAMVGYATGERHSGIMQPVASGLSPAERRAAVEYYAGLPRGPAAPAASHPDDESRIERGRRIAESGIPEAGVPSCVDCHGPSTRRRNPAYPELAGQFAEYLELQLELFREHRRGGSPFAHLMRHVAERLDAGQARDVAAWFASLPATEEGR